MPETWRVIYDNKWNCCIKWVPLVIFIYDARTHIHINKRLNEGKWQTFMFLRLLLLLLLLLSSSSSIFFANYSFCFKYMSFAAVRQSSLKGSTTITILSVQINSLDHRLHRDVNLQSRNECNNISLLWMCRRTSIKLADRLTVTCSCIWEILIGCLSPMEYPNFGRITKGWGWCILLISLGSWLLTWFEVVYLWYLMDFWVVETYRRCFYLL